MGTLIKRVCDPTALTNQERTDIEVELGYQTGASLKLRVHAVMGIAQEIMKGRMPSGVMSSWLTADEMADASTVLTKMGSGEFGTEEVWMILLLGEMRLYTPPQIEAIFGLT